MWKKVGEIKLTDSYTKVSSLRLNKSYNLRIFKSEKIGVDGDVKLLKAIALIAFFCRRYIGLVWVSLGSPHTMISYWRDEEDKELFKEIRTLVGRRCLTLKNIPQVFDSFLERQSTGGQPTERTQKGVT